MYPINIENTHWTLAVTFVNEHTIIYYDSCGGSGKKYLEALTKYYSDHGDNNNWTLVDNLQNTPQQLNSCDCGVFLCISEHWVVHGRVPSYTMDYLNNIGQSSIETSIKSKEIFKIKL